MHTWNTKMKALVLEDIAKIEYKDVPNPVIKSGEVLLKVKACGICSSDIPRIFTTGTYHFPTIPGHEFSGQIVDCASDVDKSLIGKNAAVFPLLPCRKCDSCKIEEYARCSNYNYFGSRCDGGFSEYISVPVWNLVLCPDDIPYTSAAMCEPASVAKHCVDTGEIKDGDTVTIIGTGTIGLIAALWVKSLGVKKIIIAGTSERSLKFANTLGINCAVNASSKSSYEDYLELTNGKGSDVVLECVGKQEAIINAVLYAKKGGRVVLTGNPYGDIIFPKDIYWKILRNELTICGTWNSSYKSTVNNWKETVNAIGSGSIELQKLITHKYSLSEYVKAFETVKNRDVFSVKVMFEM